MASEPPYGEMLVSEVLEDIHRDLVESAEKRTGDWNPLFRIEDVEIELHVRVKRDAQMGGGIKAYVVNFGASGSEAEERSHKISVRLKPLSGKQETVPVGRGTKDPIIRGPQDDT